MFEDFLSLVSNFGIEVSNNSYFTGNTDSNLTITTLANYYFTSTHNSKINLAKSIVTGLGSVSYAYYLSHNSEISFNSATNPTPQTSNTYVGTSPIGFLFPNTLILPPNADATKLGCALYLY
jgi:hypothetical protein